jgi:hypothetical protein
MLFKTLRKGVLARFIVGAAAMVLRSPYNSAQSQHIDFPPESKKTQNAIV